MVGPIDMAACMVEVPDAWRRGLVSSMAGDGAGCDVA